MRSPPPRVGFTQARFNLDVLEVPDEVMVAFSATVDQLAADVQAERSKLPTFQPTSDVVLNPALLAAALAAWQSQLSARQQAFAEWLLPTWDPWLTAWRAWALEHQTGLSRLPSSAGIEFGQWRSQYNQRLNEFVDLGGETDLEPVDPVQKDPPEGPGFFDKLAEATVSQVIWTSALAVGAYFVYREVTKPSSSSR